MNILKSIKLLCIVSLILSMHIAQAMHVAHWAQRTAQTMQHRSAASISRAWTRIKTAYPHIKTTIQRTVSKQMPHIKLAAKPCLGLSVSAAVWWNTYQRKARCQASHEQPPIASIWHERAQDKRLTRDDLVKHFIEDCKKYEHFNCSIPAHTKNESSARIATFNVHGWKDPYEKSTLQEIMRVISDINPDVIVLQEALLCDNSIKKAFEALGYAHQSFCRAAQGRCSFGNLILSKYPFAEQPTPKTFAEDKKHRGEQRCYVKAQIQLPHDKTITLYGTHFDVYDATEHRRTKEAEELVADSAQLTNCMIALDANAVRQSDYNYTVNNSSVWQMLNANHMQRTGIPAPTKALNILESSFTDSFRKGNQPGPKFTVWTGTTVDFLWLKKEWNLKLKGSYVYYTGVSDHLPVFVDVDLTE